MKTPIAWLGRCFVHVRSNDLQDDYHLDPDGAEVGRLTHDRTRGMWLASLRGVVAVAQREQHEPAWAVDEALVARRALDEALAKLRRKAEADQEWLARIDKEMG